ncbi:MAG: peptidoglycan-binding protein [Nocardiopsaceae bacterium]|jgi:peptidoglycan hydrolase-like protein with peptidoglycan-binding domain|nr:peptidoglycan-binding protein [Nocardiopsaceae bacterium]
MTGNDTQPFHSDEIGGVARDADVAEDEDDADFVTEADNAGGLFRRRGARLPGAPDRRSRALPVLVVLALLLALAAGVAAGRFISPAQIAANTEAPKASLITAHVRFGVLEVPVNIRASVSNGNPTQVGAPSDLNGSLPVVTSVNVAPGQRVGQAHLLLTVAERPVFLFGGAIPVFRQMSPGIHGADVAELQKGLAAAGYGVGSDASGRYGPGTAAAVAALYKANGVTPSFAGSPGSLSRLSRQVNAASRALSAAQDKLAADEAAKAGKAKLAADRAAVTQAERHLAAVQRSLARAQKTTGAQIPMGEAIFVSHLPARILSVAKLGATVGSGSDSGSGSRRGPGSSSAVQLGSGKVSLSAFAPISQARLLRPGMKGMARSDVSGSKFVVRIISVRGSRLTLVPVGRVAGGVVGQNVQVTITASRVRSFIVPVAAVSTGQSNETFVTLSTGGGGTKAVPVRLGVSSGGLQAVTPVKHDALRQGDLVVLGIGTTKHS